MKENHPLKLSSRLTGAAIAIMLSLTPVAAQAEEYKFKITNNTDQTITKVLVSEDGEKYGFFNIGKGIKAGQTAELVWAEHTNEGECEQYFKAVFANGEESEAEKFDFCESEVALEFE